MDEITYYFKINDLNLIGKMEDYIDYIYDKDKGWVIDNERLLSDRMIGYDASEEPGSHYGIGNTDMLSRINEITEEEAKILIAAT